MSPSLHQVLNMLLVFIVWCFYCVWEGTREAYYYHVASLTTVNVNGKYNLHFLYTIQRVLVITLCLLACGAKFPAMMEVFSLVYLFPYFHDGAYYCKRNDLNPIIYKKRWRDDSSTSTAKYEIKYKARLFMFVFGIVLLSGTIILTYFNIFR